MTRILRVDASACRVCDRKRTASAPEGLVSVGVKLTVLVGGVGGARFLLGVQHLLGLGRFMHYETASKLGAPHARGGELTAIVNIGDDAWMYGVRICPDLDTCMYTLGGGIDPERGWGHRDETWHAKEELVAYGVQPDWFGLGDRDLATHLVRSQMLRAGYPLSQVTEALCQRWEPGARLLPASDDRSETHVVITDPGTVSGAHPLPGVVGALPRPGTDANFAFVGADSATASPGVVDAIATADVVLLAPSNPVVSIGPILAIGGIRAALRSTPAPIIGYSPSSAESRCAAWPTNACR